MKRKIILMTAYQQLVMHAVFYNGSVWFQGHQNGHTWVNTNFFDKNGAATQKCKDYTFIYSCFFSLQFFNIFNCRITYEDELSLFKFLKHFIPEAYNTNELTKKSAISIADRKYSKRLFWAYMLFVALL